jgi:hypothetical protein
MSIELVNAIQSLRPTAEFHLDNGDYSTIVWDVLDGTAPTLAQVQAEVKRLQDLKVSEQQERNTAKAALLDRLGITAEEANLLLS